MYNLNDIDIIKEVQQALVDYKVRRLTIDGLQELYDFCKANKTYYRYMRMEPTMENLSEVFSTLPPNKDIEDKFFMGIYDDERLVEILDIVRGWPKEDIAYIGWFMVNKDIQGKGIGREIIDKVIEVLRNVGFCAVMLGCIKDNVEAYRFWTKNGFEKTGKETDTGDYIILEMKKEL